MSLSILKILREKDSDALSVGITSLVLVGATFSIESRLSRNWVEWNQAGIFILAIILGALWVTARISSEKSYPYAAHNWFLKHMRETMGFVQVAMLIIISFAIWGILDRPVYSYTQTLFLVLLKFLAISVFWYGWIKAWKAAHPLRYAADSLCIYICSVWSVGTCLVFFTVLYTCYKNSTYPDIFKVRDVCEADGYIFSILSVIAGTILWKLFCTRSTNDRPKKSFLHSIGDFVHGVNTLNYNLRTLISVLWCITFLALNSFGFYYIWSQKAKDSDTSFDTIMLWFTGAFILTSASSLWSFISKIPKSRSSTLANEKALGKARAATDSEAQRAARGQTHTIGLTNHGYQD